MAEKTELLDQLERLAESQKTDFESGLTLLELSQKAADMYASKTPEQKRVIITELLSGLTANGDFLSVSYTKFTRAIAQKVAETKQIIEEEKMTNRTIQKALATSVSEDLNVPERQLRSIWQEYLNTDRTFLPVDESGLLGEGI